MCMCMQVCDFGLSHTMEEAAVAAAQGSMGSPQWTAPEKLRGQRCDAASRAQAGTPLGARPDTALRGRAGFIHCRWTAPGCPELRPASANQPQCACAAPAVHPTLGAAPAGQPTGHPTPG